MRMALADAEIVIEGYIDPRDKRFETAEAEADGTQGKPPLPSGVGGLHGQVLSRADVPRHRHHDAEARESKPIIFALGAHTLDEHNIDTSIREACMYELCNRLQPGIVPGRQRPLFDDRLGRRASSR